MTVPDATPDREWRKFGSPTPFEPTEAFILEAFNTGAQRLWPDSRDPGWAAVLRRWLAERDARVKAEALRAFGGTLGVNVRADGDEWWRGYRQGQREALHAAKRYADAVEAGEQP